MGGFFATQREIKSGKQPKICSSDGVILLRILDACKPGVVDWKNRGVRLRHQILHKFDAISNCNLFLKVMATEPSLNNVFHLVGVGGADLADANPKYVRSILLQMQRYHSTKLMAKILFKKKAVSDEELLLWLNNRLKVYHQMVAAMAKMDKMNKNKIKIKAQRNQNSKQRLVASFDDKAAITDSINFCNIVSSVNPKWIDYRHIHGEEDCHHDQLAKVQNAKYLFTVIRRLGADAIFVTPRELAVGEHRAVLAVSTAIMTIAARYNEYDHLALFARNLQQIKAKMQKR